MSAAPTSSAAPPVLPRPREHPVEVATRMELVRIAYGELASGTLASAATTLVFALLMAMNFASAGLWYWLGMMLIIAAYRMWLVAAFQRAQPGPAEYRRWGLRLVLACAATALGWGASAWVFPTLIDGGPLGIAHVFVLAGLTTGSTRLLLPMRKGSIAYLLALMGPVALRFFAQADLVGAALGGCTVLFVIYMATATLRNHRTFSDALTLRIEREQLAAELTAEIGRRELREAELRDARKRAESADRAKGEFLATMSHEIRTPMNGVIGMLRVLEETTLTAEQHEYARTAAESAESLLLLVNDVLDFAKLEAGRLELETAVFSPARVVRSVADLMAGRARAKGLRFDVRTGELPASLRGDSGRLRQILVNLLGNAVKFTDRGGVEFVATGTPAERDRVRLSFEVSDTGIGIEPGVVNRLFQPFSQADASLSRRYGGTGLGLALSDRLARAMGGTIEFHGAAGQGSVFRLTVPFELAGTVPAGDAPPFLPPALRGRVLVVEDDPVNRQVIELFLGKLGLAPTFATDGEAAVAVATSEVFDVVLMDCQLPGIDGLEATRRIRAQLGSQPLRIVALTANAGPEIREACLAAGMNDFLGKPLRLELLADLMRRNLPPHLPLPQ